MLQFEAINLFIGNLHVLWDLAPQVKKGEDVVILGSNGGGKSTKLKAISASVPLQSSIINYEGLDLAHSHLRRLRGIEFCHGTKFVRGYDHSRKSRDGRNVTWSKLFSRKELELGVRALPNTKGAGEAACMEHKREGKADAC